MNRAQVIALTYHCRLACETAHQRFHKMDGPNISIMLTVNSGYE